MIPRELELKILHLSQVEGWPVGTIVSQLGVHHDAVERVLEQAGGLKAREVRPTLIDPFLPFIQETWARYPKLHASRLYGMCKARGYPGAPDHFRHLVAPLRPKPPAEAYLRLRTLAGEQAQIDWAYFGKLTIGRAVRTLCAFLAVLSFSRALFLRFFLGQCCENFLRGHEAAFARWGGVARVLLYDNLRSAVLERVGDAIHFNPTLLEFSAHYHFEARPVAPARGNEKARVERAVRYVRSSFFPGRTWRDLDDLNAQAEAWCFGDAMERPWPEDHGRKVRDAFEEERPKLRPLPPNPFPTEERREVAIGKTPYARFDCNDYSVPHTHVRKTLVVVATLETIRILDGTDEVARHPRSFDRGQQIENSAHIQALIEAKRAARKHRAIDRLAHGAPSSRTLLERLAERGANLGNVTQRLLLLLDTYGAEALERAIGEALACGAPHVDAVRQILERNRAHAGLPPALPLPLPANPRLHGLKTRPHDLRSYDDLFYRKPASENDHDDPSGTPAPV